MSFRSSIPDFQLANPLYTGALVRFFTIDVNGVKTAVLAPLYANPLGAQTVSNPVVLDAEGKFSSPVYHDVPIIGEVVGSVAASVDTGIIMPASSWGGNWTAATLLIVNTFVRDPLGLSIYIATNTYTSAGSLATDVAAGNLELVFQGASADAAAASAAAAAASAVLAAAALGAIQTQRRVAIAYQSTPPGSPSAGNAYIVLTAGTGAWAGQSEKIATWSGSAWTFETPSTGWSCWLTGNSQNYDYNGANWQSGVVRADVSQTALFSAPQKLQARQNIGITSAGDALAIAADVAAQRVILGQTEVVLLNNTLVVAAATFGDVDIRGYKSVEIECGIFPNSAAASDPTALLRFATDTVPTFLFGGSDYQFRYTEFVATAAPVSGVGTNSSIYLSGTADRTASSNGLYLKAFVTAGPGGSRASVMSDCLLFKTGGLGYTRAAYDGLLTSGSDATFLQVLSSVAIGFAIGSWCRVIGKL